MRARIEEVCVHVCSLTGESFAAFRADDKLGGGWKHLGRITCSASALILSVNGRVLCCSDGVLCRRIREENGFVLLHCGCSSSSALFNALCSAAPILLIGPRFESVLPHTAPPFNRDISQRLRTRCVTMACNDCDCCVENSDQYCLGQRKIDRFRTLGCHWKNISQYS